MEKLISMTDFVLEQSKLTGYDISDYDWIIRIVNYAKFLKQPLKLEMFVPYDENHGGVLKKPCDEELEKFKGLQYGDFDCNYTYIFDYNQAKEKVLFEDFTVLSEEDDVVELECKDIYINYNKEEDLFFLDSWNNDALIMNIECLVNLINHTASSIKLTENAIKTFK